jgi:hypothetical protein
VCVCCNVTCNTPEASTSFIGNVSLIFFSGKENFFSARIKHCKGLEKGKKIIKNNGCLNIMPGKKKKTLF